MTGRVSCAARPAARRGWPAWLMFLVAFVVWAVVLGALRPVSWALLQLFGLAS